MNTASRLFQRRVQPLRGLAVTASILALYATTATVAVGREDCHFPDVVWTLGDISFIAHGENGPTVGDRRVLTHTLSDTDGQQVGIVHAMSTVLHSPDAGATTIYVDGTMMFDTGTLHWSNVQTLADPSDTTRSRRWSRAEPAPSGMPVVSSCSRRPATARMIYRSIFPATTDG
jgi:hypothetical protein